MANAGNHDQTRLVKEWGRKFEAQRPEHTRAQTERARRRAARATHPERHFDRRHTYPAQSRRRKRSPPPRSRDSNPSSSTGRTPAARISSQPFAWRDDNKWFQTQPENLFLHYHASQHLYTLDVYELSLLNLAHLQGELARMQTVLHTTRGEFPEGFYRKLNVRLATYGEAMQYHRALTESTPSHQLGWLGTTFEELRRTQYDNRLNAASRARLSAYSNASHRIAKWQAKVADDIRRPGPFHGDKLREFFSRRLPAHLAWGPEEQELARDRYALRRGRGQHPRLPSPFVDRLARVIYAFLAGATLIVPMLIMTVNGPYAVKSIVTVCVAVFLFGIAAALGVKLENKEIFAVTATYAAVLVVFIGVTTDTGTSAGG